MSSKHEPQTEPHPIGWRAHDRGATVTAHLTATAMVNGYPMHDRRSDMPRFMIEEWTWPESDSDFCGIELMIIGGLDVFREGERSLFLVDDGTTVTPYYVAGYHPKRRYLGLKRFTPTVDPGRAYPLSPSAPARAYHICVIKKES